MLCQDKITEPHKRFGTQQIFQPIADECLQKEITAYYLIL